MNAKDDIAELQVAVVREWARATSGAMRGVQAVLRVVADWAEPERRNLRLIDENTISITAPAGATLTAGDFLLVDELGEVEGKPPPEHLIQAKDVSLVPPTVPKPEQAGGAVVVRISLQPDHAVTGGLYSGPVFADGTEVKTARVQVAGDDPKS
jgi:hypothetical protein